MSDTAGPFGAARIRRRCEETLWGPSGQPAEQRARLQEMEGYVRLLAPKLSKLMPRMRDDMRATARIVLRYADELLDSGPASGDLARRLHDAAVNARALLGLLERPGELTPDTGTVDTPPVSAPGGR
ncbi:hypothetical protein [Streptomyces violarus]|uniref:hypothetical protein n=1 Tax=Streptomyces violarus TaxID=67380 RepID=UPI0021BF0631|nr:hypothetical protein [Streptomyces violarus]MCT9142621.1 hypothetical protein [Streptomyces violarus]